jgi:hypothetical protein
MSKPFLRPLAALMPVLPLVLASPLSVLADPPPSSQLDQSASQFVQPPQLLSTSASASQRNQDGFYYFSIQVPEAAGRPLAAVTIDPQSRRAGSITFDLEQTEAFVGTPAAQQDALALRSVGRVEDSRVGDSRVEDSDAVQIVFAQPVQPGTTITVGLKPSQTPERRRYEFGVTAIPAASSADVAALGQPAFLGNGEVSFRGQRYRDYPFWWRNDGLLSTGSEGDHRVLFWDLPPEFDPRLRRRN